MKLEETVAGKTIAEVMYLSHELVGIEFTDGTYLRIYQPSQSGALNVYYLDNVAHEVDADDKEEN